MKSIRCSYRFLEMGLEGFEYLASLWGIAKETGRVEDELEIRELCLEVIEVVLNKKLYEIGIYNEKIGFEKWNLSNDEVLKKIETEWRFVDRFPEKYENGLFNLTEKGEKIALALTQFRNFEKELFKTVLASNSFYGRTRFGEVEVFALNIDLRDGIGEPFFNSKTNKNAWDVVHQLFVEKLIEFEGLFSGFNDENNFRENNEIRKIITESGSSVSSILPDFKKKGWIVNSEKGNKIGVEILEKSGLDLSVLGKPYQICC